MGKCKLHNEARYPLLQFLLTTFCIIMQFFFLMVFCSFMQGSEIYGRELVDLRKESRWEFLNTFFSVSEAVAYMQVLSSLRSHLFTLLCICLSKS